MGFYVHKKENIFFIVKVLATLSIVGAFWLGMGAGDKIASGLKTFGFYVLGFMTFAWIRSGLFVGFVRGSCVRVGPEQFPDIYSILSSHSTLLNLKQIPSLYIMQQGGILNALAMRFVGKNYVVIYSDVLAAAYKEGVDAVSFIIAHELGHIKRMHMTKNLFLFPSLFVPFLHNAYSRACEYTCDGIGFGLNQSGSVKGLCILSVGPALHDKVNIIKYIEESSRERGFWVWLSEKLSSHPFLPNRIANLGKIHQLRTLG